MVKPQGKKYIITIWTGEERFYTVNMTANWEQMHLTSILSQYELKDMLEADGFRLFFNNFKRKHLIWSRNIEMEIKTAKFVWLY